MLEWCCVAWATGSAADMKCFPGFAGYMERVAGMGEECDDDDNEEDGDEDGKDGWR
jgi:hypothetical protein